MYCTTIEENYTLLSFSILLIESVLKEFQDSCDVQADGGIKLDFLLKGLCHPWRMWEPMKTNLKKLGQLFQVLSEILEGCFHLLKSQLLFDSQQSVVLRIVLWRLQKKVFLRYFLKCLPFGIFFTWIYSVLASNSVFILEIV